MQSLYDINISAIESFFSFNAETVHEYGANEVNPNILAQPAKSAFLPMP